MAHINNLFAGMMDVPPHVGPLPPPMVEMPANYVPGMMDPRPFNVAEHMAHLIEARRDARERVRNIRR